MGLHRNACSCREAARRRGASPTTACKWWQRWSKAPVSERASLHCLEDRSSRPLRSPRGLPASERARICAARRRSGWGPRLLASETGHPMPRSGARSSGLGSRDQPVSRGSRHVVTSGHAGGLLNAKRRNSSRSAGRCPDTAGKRRSHCSVASGVSPRTTSQISRRPP